VRAEQALQRGRRGFRQEGRVQDTIARVRREPSEVALDLSADDLVALLDAAQGSVQTPAQGGAQREPDARIAADHLGEALVVKAKQLALAFGDDRRRAGLTGEQRHFSEAVARPERRDPQPRPGLRVPDEHAEAAVGHKIEAVASLALDAGGLASGEGDSVKVGGDFGEGDAIEPGEEAGFGQKIGRAPAARGLFLSVALVSQHVYGRPAPWSRSMTSARNLGPGARLA
jgi:hypothetical protein